MQMQWASLYRAGGTLVLGSVFKSIIERTKMNLNLQNQYPEPWLKYAFTELHKIFFRALKVSC